MKPIIVGTAMVGAALISVAVVWHLGASSGGGHFGHGTVKEGGESATVRLNEPGFATCGRQFFDSVYALTREVFSAGADNVVLAEYENKLFALVRSSDAFGDNPQPFIDHIKDIPRQTIAIVKEDPTVLDSCVSFQLAMVGPQ